MSKFNCNYIIILGIVFYFYFYNTNKIGNRFKNSWLELVICIIFGLIAFYNAPLRIIDDLEKQPPYISFPQFIFFYVIVSIFAFIIIQIPISAINLKNNFQNLIRTTVVLIFLIGLNITIENYLENNDSSQKEYIFYETKTAPSETLEIKGKLLLKNNELNEISKNESISSKSTNNNEFWDLFLKFISKLLEIIAIGSLAGFILLYRPEKPENTSKKSKDPPEKSDLKNEQPNNPTSENNQTDTTKSEPEQSSEEKESPHG